MARASFTPGYRWDGTHRGPNTTRTLRIDRDSPTRIVRTALMGTCHHCGNPAEWSYTAHHDYIPLHPAELPTRHIPPPLRWHTVSGIAYPTAAGSPWCRIAHPDLCPATRPRPRHPTTPELDELRRTLALRTRLLADRGLQPRHPDTTTAPLSPTPPPRPVVHLLQTNYLARHPVSEIRCVAQTRRGHRCHNPVDTATPSGHWTLVPLGADKTAPDDHKNPPLMAVYHLSHLPHVELLRWRAQHCARHTTGRFADVALPEWEVLHSARHRQHIHTTLPTPQTAGDRHA
ncbi:DUF6083 domain-containing protein [Kitasatospora sp. NPDC089509]|uniref:DUF6083 domain-containing protein n=1 Tax=Kitasatospora sp. NPDC089509 TaxID=3364079 RepID=UPI00381BA5F1